MAEDKSKPNLFGIVENQDLVVNLTQDFKGGVGYLCVTQQIEAEGKAGKTVYVTVPFVITSKGIITRADSPDKFNISGIVPSTYPWLIHKNTRWPYDHLKSYLDGEVKIDPVAILETVAGIYEKYLDFPEADAYLVLAIWTMGTYLFRIFEAYPYIYLHGTKGSGKTKALLVAEKLCYNSIMCSDITKAALFRTVESSAATVLIDEAEHLKGSGRDEELARLLNAGYKKGLYAVRTDLQTFKTQSFDVYSPKILAGIRGLDPVLEDRCIVLTMIKTLDARKGNLAIAERNEDWGYVRHLLYCYALTYFSDVADCYEAVIKHMSSASSVIQSRKGELWFPLLSLALHMDCLEESNYFNRLEAFAKKSIKEADQEGLDELSTALLLGLESLFKELFDPNKKEKTLVTELYLVQKAMKKFLEDDREVSTVWIGQQLKRWRLDTKKRKKRGFEYTIKYSEVQDRIKRYMPHREESEW